MGRLVTASAVLPLVIAAGCMRTTATSDACRPAGNRAALAGIGSRALTDRVAATYFIRSIDPGGDMVIDLVVFLKGQPGWTRDQGDWKFHTAAPVASSRYSIAGKPFRVDLDLTKDESKVLDRTIPTATANIVVVDGFGRDDWKVSYTEHQDLRAPFDGDPLVEFLNRSPALQEALELAPRKAGRGASCLRRREVVGVVARPPLGRRRLRCNHFVRMSSVGAVWS